MVEVRRGVGRGRRSGGGEEVKHLGVQKDIMMPKDRSSTHIFIDKALRTLGMLQEGGGKWQQ